MGKMGFIISTDQHSPFLWTKNEWIYWLLLIVVGCRWLSLVVVVVDCCCCGCWLLVVVGCCWLFVVGCCGCCGCWMLLIVCCFLLPNWMNCAWYLKPKCASFASFLACINFIISSTCSQPNYEAWRKIKRKAKKGIQCNTLLTDWNDRIMFTTKRRHRTLTLVGKKKHNHHKTETNWSKNIKQ